LSHHKGAVQVAAAKDAIAGRNLAITQGNAALASGDTETALDNFNKVLRTENSIAGLWGRGQVYEQLGQRNLAVADYKKAVEQLVINPEDTDIQENSCARLAELEGKTSDK
jgi:Flp pilus assembly protein TadD